MAIQKIEIRPEGVNDYGDLVYPKTSSDMVEEVTNKKFVTDAEKTNIGKIPTIEQSINEHKAEDMTKAGGTFTGITTAYSNTSYTVAQLRNVILSTSDAVLESMQDGEIWIKYV